MNVTLSFLADAWWAWIAPLTVQLAVLAAVFALIDRFVLRRAAVRVRMALAWAFFARIVLPPSFESPVSIASALPPVTVDAGTAPAVALSLAAIWLVGALLAVGALARAIRRDRRDWLRDTSAPAHDVLARASELARAMGLARTPRVLEASGARGPAAVGFLAPIVVVPARLVGARLDHALLHEFAHVARRDSVQALLWSVARVVFWFHPAVHCAAAHAALLREIACDERAVQVLGNAATYRATLLALSDPAPPRRPSWSPAFVPTGPQILSRALALDAAIAARGARVTAQAAACFVLAVACVVPLARSTTEAVVPALGELDGCLRTRYAVMAALAREANAHTDSITSHPAKD